MTVRLHPAIVIGHVQTKRRKEAPFSRADFVAVNRVYRRVYTGSAVQIDPSDAIIRPLEDPITSRLTGVVGIGVVGLGGSLGPTAEDRLLPLESRMN